MSHEALSDQQFMYHKAPTHHRASIQEHGLQARTPSSESGSDLPHGVYLLEDQKLAHQHMGQGDVWKVNVKGLPLHRDPDPSFQWGGRNRSHYHPSDIEPHRVEHVGESPPEWKPSWS